MTNQGQKPVFSPIGVRVRWTVQGWDLDGEGVNALASKQLEQVGALEPDGEEERVGGRHREGRELGEGRVEGGVARGPDDVLRRDGVLHGVVATLYM
eukprot:1181690-Prorocentrum_minimum.AAC.1